MSNLLYVSASTDGWQNLAADEYFLDSIGEDDMLLHFYVNRSAVIIGRAQNPWAECNLRAMELDGVQLVRRITGGGAVYHDSGNLNFSFIAGEKHYSVERQLNMILRAVRALGIPCEFTGRNDLLSDGRKFSGNAFCTRKGVSQHHGTLLVRSDLSRLQHYLNVDPRKLQSKGVKSVRSRVCNLSETAPDLTVDALLHSLQFAFRGEYGPYTELTSADLPADQLLPYVRKHASEQWLLGSTPRFDTEIDHRFPWGRVQLLLTLRQGVVDHLDVYTDALDPGLADEVRMRLSGISYNAGRMSQALMQSEKTQIRELAAFLHEQRF